VKSFFETLTPDEQQLFVATKLSEQLLDDIKRADAAHKAESKSRKISTVLKPFLTGVLQYGNAMDVFAQSSSFLIPIWGSARIVLHVGPSVHQTSILILRLRCHVASIRVRGIL
jgi:hypothetical protein